MKILHVIDSGGLYGAEVMLLNLMEEQCQQGLVPILASIGEHGISEKPLEAAARHRGLRIETFRMRPGPNFVAAFNILRFARREGIDIIHSHGYKGNILFGMIPKSLRRIPIVATLHGWTWTGGWNRMRLYEWLDRISLRFIDRVVVVNEAMRDKLKLKKLYVVNNGVPTEEPGVNTNDATDATITAFCAEGFIVGAIGRLSPEKGFDILLDAVSEVLGTHPNVRLLILGEGNERGVLEAKIKRLGLEQSVLLPGYVANAKCYLPLFNVFVLSSLTEGLPIVILEAMQAGVPIVATRVGGIPEVLENGKAGKLVVPGNCAVLVNGISEVSDNSVRTRQLVQVAIRRVSDLYSIKGTSEKYLDIYLGIT